MKKKISVLLLLFYIIVIKSQTVSGSIHDFDDGELINSANIIIKELSNSDHIIQYKVVNNGNFSIAYKKNYKDIVIEITSYGYLNYKKVIKNIDTSKKYHLEVRLQKDKSVNLEEVLIIGKKKFEVKKDTVTYNVSAYKDGTERKIAELIKKLPGIQVDEKGKIEYNGKPIETVLLEGDNLFGHNYTLGTKNINIDMVKQVQAIDKYSENSLLKGIENDDKVALNLILKKGKIDFSGNMDLGVGIYNKEKAALDLSANILGITKNYKSFATLVYNNIGINYSPFNYFGSRIDVEHASEKDFFSQKIIPETSFSNIVNDERVNINNQYFSNYNAIFKINKRLKLKTNLYYINDKITSNQFFENNYVINETPISTTDFNSVKKKPKQYRGDLEIKYNTSKTSLLEYYFRIQQENIKTPIKVTSNNSTNFESLFNSEDFYLKQKLLYTKKVSAKKALQFSLFQSTNAIPQTFQISPSIINSNLYNSDIQKSKYIRNYIELNSILLGSTKKKNKYTFSIGGFVDNNKLQSELFSKNNMGNTVLENGINNLNYSKKELYQIGSYTFRYNHWKFLPTYSLSYINQNIKDKERKETKTQNDLILEPSLRINYRLNGVSYLSGKIGYNQTLNTEKYLFQNTILTSNRLTITNTPSFELQKSTNYGLYYFNNDLYNQLQIDFGVNFQKIKGNFFTNSLITENTTQINYYFSAQNSNNLNFNFLIIKYIPFMESTVKLNSNYSILKYKNIVNNSELRNNKSQFVNTELFIKTAFDGFINFENTLNVSNYISENENSQQFTNQSLKNTFKIIVKPFKRWNVLITSDYFLPNTKNKSENYTFLDTSIRYRPKNKKFEFSIIAKNLLNEDNLEQIQTSDFSTSRYRTSILPRYYLMKVSFNF